MSDFALVGYRRRIARSLVKTIAPAWPEFEADLTEDVLDGVESFIRGYPPLVRFGVMAMFFLVELGGPLTFTGIVPFSFLSPEAAERRLQRWVDHPIGLVRNVPKFLKILVCFNAYCHPKVETFLGTPRRPWRENRVRFRETLIQLDERRPTVPVPEPIGSEPEVRPSDYLAFPEDKMNVESP